MVMFTASVLQRASLPFTPWLRASVVCCWYGSARPYCGRALGLTVEVDTAGLPMVQRDRYEPHWVVDPLSLKGE